jgi:HlyD family secretion protein
VKKKILIVIILLAVAAAVAIYFIYFNKRSSSTIKVSGNIEATEIRLSFQVAGKIQRLFVDEGFLVKKGDIVAVLDKNELTKIKQQAQAGLELAKANLSLNEKEYARMQNLFKDNVISAQERDVAQNKFEIAKAALDSASHTLDLAGIRLGYADLSCPVDGFIITKSAEAGEVMQPGSTVFTVLDLNDIWLTAYINETDLGKVKLNQEVVIKTDTYLNKNYIGRISFISEEAEFTPKQIQTTEERVKLVYRIKIIIANSNFELKPGMPADGFISLLK